MTATLSPATPPKLAYGVVEAARALGVGKSTVWRLVAAGELTTFPLGARTLIPADDLVQLVERRRRAA